MNDRHFAAELRRRFDRVEYRLRAVRNAHHEDRETFLDWLAQDANSASRFAVGRDLDDLLSCQAHGYRPTFTPDYEPLADAYDVLAAARDLPLRAYRSA